MTQATNTHQAIIDLDTYLRDNNYFDENETGANQKIAALWTARIESALDADITSRFDNVAIDFVVSDFELSSENSQGACLFFHKVIITDKINTESVQVFIKTLIHYNKTILYLDSNHASMNNWPWESKQLTAIVDKLNTANKNSGYFNPISLSDFIQ